MTLLSASTETAATDSSAAAPKPKEIASSAQRLRKPLALSGALDKFQRFDLTPHIGTEFENGVQLSQLLKAANSDDLIRDLAITASRRNVVFFRNQDITIEEQKELGRRLGELTGKPATSKLHVHPVMSFNEHGEEISRITSEGRNDYHRAGIHSEFASVDWHSDITFEPIPSDYAILKMHTLPPTGGDTLWSSAYELYDRLSPAFATFLEGLTATHNADYFQTIADLRGLTIRQGRGAPENAGDRLEAVHPVIRTNPVTGWKGVFVVRDFTRQINELSKDESDAVLQYLFRLNAENHDLQVRFQWRKNDVAIWDNRSSLHTATYDYDYQSVLRAGDRVVSLGERPYFDPASKSRREDLGILTVRQLRFGVKPESR
ncbi:TfdA family taurine catabolism dioxygenase TauD [Zopfochytrium polystomum]|nr:TfdA family taurine catabolism dioxygenase TauD [Zopfochytrium polystomum]